MFTLNGGFWNTLSTTATPTPTPTPNSTPTPTPTPTPTATPTPNIVRFIEFLPDTQEISRGVVVGQTAWETVLENNMQAFASDFVQRSRFTTAFPTSLTPAQFVDKLFTNAE